MNPTAVEWLLRGELDRPVRENFAARELACKCGRCDGFVVSAAADSLQTLRTLWGGPLRVISGYRCEAHNRAVDGAAHSYHRLGAAFDVDWGHVDRADRPRFVERARLAGFTGLGFYVSWIHVDRGPARQWGDAPQ